MRAANPAEASRLQSLRSMRRVAELGRSAAAHHVHPGSRREKEHAARYLHNQADTLVVGRVIDAAHDLLEGVTSADAVAPVFAEAFATGGGGAWEQTGSWMRKLARAHPSLHQLWLQLAPHKSARIRFRVAAFLND